MAITPITGILRKRFIIDLSSCLGLGTASAYAYWYGLHLKKITQIEEFYLKLEKEKYSRAT